MNKRLVLLSCFLLVSVAAYAQYPYKWQIGGTMGMGGTIYTDGGDPTMSMTIGFNKAVQNTKWRWSIEAGIMNQGIVDYFFEDDAPDIFVRPNFEYVGVIADYSLFSKGEGFNIFARGGFAPAHQRDLYVYHSEDRFTALGLIGVGADYYKIRSITTQSHGKKSSSFFGASPPKNAKNLIKIARARTSAASVFGALPPRRGQEGQKGARRPSVSEHMHPLL